MNRNVIIGLCAGLVLVIAAIATVLYIEYDVENQINTTLTQNNITAKSVKYSIFADTLTVKNVEINNLLISESKISIDEIIVIQPNPEAFDTKSFGQPLVAKELVINNVNGEYQLDSVKQNYNVGNINIKNWRQNLGKLLELKDHGYGEVFFTALLDCSIESVVYSDLTSTDKLLINNELLDLVTKISSMELKDITPTIIGSYTLNDVTQTITDEQSKKITSQAGKFTWGPIHMPAPRYWAFVSKFVPSIQEGKLSEKHALEIVTHPDISTKLFSNTAINIENLNMKQYEGTVTKDLLKMQGISFATEFDMLRHTSAKLSANVKGIDVDINSLSLPRKEHTIVSHMLGNILAIDASLAVDLATNKKQSSVKLAFGVQNAGKVETSVEAILPDDVLPNLLGFDKENQASIIAMGFMGWFQNVLFVSAQTSYEDSGLLPKSLIVASKQSKHPVEVIWHLLSQQISQEMRKELAIIGSNNIKAIEQCLKNPGTLKVSASPTHFMTPQAVMSAVIADQSSLGLAVKCTPGKNIVESANALLSDDKNFAADMGSEPDVSIQSPIEIKIPNMFAAITQALPEKSASTPSPQVTEEKTQVQPQVAPQVQPQTAPQVEPKTPVVAAPVTKPAPSTVTPKPETTKKPVLDDNTTKATTAQQAGSPVAPAPNKPGKAVIVPTTQDNISLKAFAADQKTDSCIQVMVQAQSQLTAVRLESFGGINASWKTKDAKASATGVLAVQQGSKMINANDASFSLDVASPTTLELCVQDNGAIADEHTRLRVVFFYANGSRAYSVLAR